MLGARVGSRIKPAYLLPPRHIGKLEFAQWNFTELDGVVLLHLHVQQIFRHDIQQQEIAPLRASLLKLALVQHLTHCGGALLTRHPSVCRTRLQRSLGYPYMSDSSKLEAFDSTSEFQPQSTRVASAAEAAM